jgi:peptidoglycan-N-acetylglucosamine deacetylase
VCGFSVNSVQVLKKSGLIYDSSMMGLDEAYKIDANASRRDSSSSRSNGLHDAPYFGATGPLPVPELMFKVNCDEFDVAHGEGTLVMLTFHPHVSGHQVVGYVKQNAGKSD